MVLAQASTVLGATEPAVPAHTGSAALGHRPRDSSSPVHLTDAYATGMDASTRNCTTPLCNE